MNAYTVIDGGFKLAEILANLFIMGIPVMVVMTLDRRRNDWHGGRYYWLVFVLVAAWNVFLFNAIPARIMSPKVSPQGWWAGVAVLANLVILGISIVIVMALDRYWKGWRGRPYYLLAFAIAVVAQFVVLGIPYAAIKAK